MVIMPVGTPSRITVRKVDIIHWEDIGFAVGVSIFAGASKGDLAVVML